MKANHSVTDMYGKPIEVTDIDKAIEQAEMCSDSFYIMPDGKTFGDYYKDMLPKLKALKEVTK